MVQATRRKQLGFCTYEKRLTSQQSTRMMLSDSDDEGELELGLDQGELGAVESAGDHR